MYIFSFKRIFPLCFLLELRPHLGRFYHFTIFEVEKENITCKNTCNKYKKKKKKINKLHYSKLYQVLIVQFNTNRIADSIEIF